MTIILDGKSLSQSTEIELAERVELIKRKIKRVPVLATILVGEDPASATYVRMKGNACERIGMDSLKVKLPSNTSTSELLKEISKLNKNPDVHGILLQHPVPEQINERLCFDAIALEKDVDGVTCLGFGKMSMGEPVYGSCTPAGIMGLLKNYKIEISGKHAVVVGRSPILGKPMALMLLNENATVTVCHSKTENLPEHIQKADILVGAVGIPRFIKSDWIKESPLL
ncbi:MAG: bifunctional protein FolD [Gammaproteobacteria bacterium]|nr:MAG: bifunctional protein FolD [Gammaproteobacteria bacterium]